MKYKILYFCFALFISFSVYGQESSKLDISKKAFIVSRFCTEVKYNFVHYGELTFDWDSLCMASLPDLVTTKSDGEFIDSLKRLCAKLHDGHTNIYASSIDNNREDWIKPFPFKTKRLGKRVFVTEVGSSLFINKGLCAGCEILKIDNEPVIQYGEKHVAPFIASSTSQWCLYAPFQNYELTKAKGSKVSTILFRTPKGKTKSITSDRNIPWDLQQNSSTLKFKILDKNIGILKINNFQNGSFKPKDFDSIYNEILKTKALIIDIRDNGGGNSKYADYVISHFSRNPIKMGSWSTPIYNAAYASWGYPRQWHMETPDPILPIKNKEIYTKPIVLLVNACTFSSAENFCVTFQGMKRGKIIGMPTGGSTGNPIIKDLGYGVEACICTKNEWTVNGTVFIGIGIIPDIEVQENEDIFLKNKDCVVDIAVKELY